jgi:hypothetical protein
MSGRLPDEHAAGQGDAAEQGDVLDRGRLGRTAELHTQVDPDAGRVAFPASDH